MLELAKTMTWNSYLEFTLRTGVIETPNHDANGMHRYLTVLSCERPPLRALAPPLCDVTGSTLHKYKQLPGIDNARQLPEYRGDNQWQTVKSPNPQRNAVPG